MAEVIGKYLMVDLKIYLLNRKTPVSGEFVRVKEKGIEGKKREYIELVGCGRDYISCPAVQARDGSVCEAVVFQRNGLEWNEIRLQKACGQRLTRKAIPLIMPEDIPVLQLPEG